MSAPARSSTPSTPNRPAGLNRTLLSVVGLISLLVGAYVVLRGIGALATGTLAAAGFPAQDPQTSLLPAGLTVAGWVPYVVILAAVVVGLLCLAWLLAQTGRRASGAGAWSFPSQDGAGHGGGDGATSMDTSAATDAFVAELESYTGIQNGRAVLSGDRTSPELHVTLDLADQAPVHELRERIDTTALPRLRQALELDVLPTEILIRLGSATPTTARTR